MPFLRFFAYFSRTICCRFMKPGPKVALKMTFQSVWPSVTLTFIQGHRVNLKMAKNAIFVVFCLFLKNYLMHTYETWPKGSPLDDLQKFLTIHDLDLCSRSQRWLKNDKKCYFCGFFAHFSRNIWCILMELGPKVAHAVTFKSVWLSMTLTLAQGQQGWLKNGKKCP